jgi:hypothetical protein
MAKIEKIWKLGETVEGVEVRPAQVDVRGVIDNAGQYAVAVKVINDAGEPLTLVLPLEYSGTFARQIQDAGDELLAGMTAKRS